MIDNNPYIEKREAELTQALANALLARKRADEDIARIESAYTELQNLKEKTRPQPPGPPPSEVLQPPKPSHRDE